LGSGGIVRILNLCIRWGWVVSFTLRRLYPQAKCRWFRLDRRLGLEAVAKRNTEIPLLILRRLTALRIALAD